MPVPCHYSSLFWSSVSTIGQVLGKKCHAFEPFFPSHQKYVYWYLLYVFFQNVWYPCLESLGLCRCLLRRSWTMWTLALWFDADWACPKNKGKSSLTTAGIFHCPCSCFNYELGLYLHFAGIRAAPLFFFFFCHLANMFKCAFTWWYVYSNGIVLFPPTVWAL